MDVITNVVLWYQNQNMLFFTTGEVCYWYEWPNGILQNWNLRRCTKWYWELVLDIIWGIIIVNSHFLYCLNSSEKMFIKSLVKGFSRYVFLEGTPLTEVKHLWHWPRGHKAVHHLIENIQVTLQQRKMCKYKICHDKYYKTR